MSGDRRAARGAATAGSRAGDGHGGSAVWNAVVERRHHVGQRRPLKAHVRYFVTARDGRGLGCLLFILITCRNPDWRKSPPTVQVGPSSSTSVVRPPYPRSIGRQPVITLRYLRGFSCSLGCLRGKCNRSKWVRGPKLHSNDTGQRPDNYIFGGPPDQNPNGRSRPDAETVVGDTAVVPKS